MKKTLAVIRTVFLQTKNIQYTNNFVFLQFFYTHPHII